MVDVAFGIDEDGEVLAIMPGIAATVACPDNMLCYAHLGQHSCCVLEYCTEHLRQAEYTEFADLFYELDSIGYDFHVIPFDSIGSADYTAMREEQLRL